MKYAFIKTIGGLAPFDDEAKVWFAKQKFGMIIRADFAAMRNGPFFRKWWVLVKYAFDNWDAPEIETKLGIAVTSFDRFRKDITMLAGFSVAEVRVDGTARYEAASLKWSKMTESAFTELYKNTVQAIITHVLDTHTQEDIDRVIGELMGF